MNPHLAGADGYAKWKEERRAFYLNLYNGDHRMADRVWALEVIDTEYFIKLGTTASALDAYKGGPAKGRKDITAFKNLCWRYRAGLARLDMSDVARANIEAVFNAIEELSETEE